KDYREQSEKSSSAISVLDRLSALNDEIKPNALTPVAAMVAPALNAIGIKTDTDPSKVREFEALKKRAVSLDLKTTFGGQLSDSEREYLDKTLPGLGYGDTTESNKNITQVLKGLKQRHNDYGSMFNNWIDLYKNSIGFDQQWNKYVEKTP